MKYIIFFLLLISGAAYGQSTYYIRADSTRLQKVGGSNELILENSTKAVTGVLVNNGNGRTGFYKPRIVGDTLFIGKDTILGVGAGSGSTYYNSNVGSGYRLAVPGTNNIKTVAPGLYLLSDSTTNANAITAKIDTASMFPVIRATIPGGSTDSIHTTFIAYVDTLGNDATGTVGNPAKPFATINAALDATASLPYVVIKVGIGTFASPSTAKFRSSMAIIGTKQPIYNNTVTAGTYPTIVTSFPTKLINGTIFRGAFRVAEVSDVQLENFGVDVGGDFIGGGANQEGFLLIISNTNASIVGQQLLKNVQVRRITVLQKDSSTLVHGMEVNGCDNPIIEDINTMGGFAGFVSKNNGGFIRNINVQKTLAGYFGIILKQTGYAYVYKTILTDFRITNGAGLNIQNEGSDGATGMNDMIISNGYIENTYYGVTQSSSGGTIINRLKLSNITVKGCTGKAFNFTDLRYSTIDNCIATGAGDTAFVVYGQATTVSNNLAYNNTNIDFSLEGTGGCTPILAYNNKGFSNGFRYGAFVYGDGNYGHGKIGTIGVTSETCIAAAEVSTLSGYTDIVFDAPTSGDLVETDRTWTTSAGGASFGHYGVGTVTLSASTDGAIAFKWGGTGTGGILGFSSNTTGITGYNVIGAGVFLGSSGVFVINSGAPVDPGISQIPGNWYQVKRTGSTYTLETSANNGASWTTIYTFPFTGNAVNAVVCDILGTTGLINYPQKNF